ncbi:MAG: hypothetical protein Q8R83_06515 [Legionellaceae bacterium]|nr:hypothetical protein [Legionellaceae bacterium]
MSQDKSSYYRLQRELIQIKQQFKSNSRTHYNNSDSLKLQYVNNPLDLIKPRVDVDIAPHYEVALPNQEYTSISYDYSYRIVVLMAVWNQCEILLKHVDNTPFSPEETNKIHENFLVFKKHPHAPHYEGLFSITDDDMYWVAVCWHRLLNTLSEDILKTHNLIAFCKTLEKNISQYTLTQPIRALLVNDNVTQHDVVTHLEEQFKEIYNIPKLNRDKLTNIQLNMLISLRVFGSFALLGLAAGFTVFVVSNPLSAFLVAVILTAIYLTSLILIGLIFNYTHVNLSISKHTIQENDKKYNELKEVIVKEFPGCSFKTAEELIGECDKLDEDMLTCAAIHLLG